MDHLLKESVLRSHTLGIAQTQVECVRHTRALRVSPASFLSGLSLFYGSAFFRLWGEVGVWRGGRHVWIVRGVDDIAENALTANAGGVAWGGYETTLSSPVCVCSGGSGALSRDLGRDAILGARDANYREF